MDNLFGTSEIVAPAVVERIRRGDGIFVVVRFRNMKDVNAFSDLINTPVIRSMKRKKLLKVRWDADERQRTGLTDFFS